MGPTRKSRSVNNRYSYIDDVSPSKDGYNAKKSNSRKRKLSDMLGPRWTMEELTRFYDSYRKYSKEWKKVAGAVRNRSAEMVEALYTMNRAYLSLPHGTASAAGLIAMMTDHYSNLAGSDSDQEKNGGAGSSRKTQKRARGKVEPPTPKALDDIASQSLITASNYGCLSLLKKNRSSVSRARPVGKRTPRFPVSFSRENINGEKFFSPTRQGLKLKANADDNEVAHEIAIALAEASQRGGSPKVSGTLNKRAESVMSSPFRHAQRKHNIAEISNGKLLATDTDEEDLEGSTEADTGELSRCKPHLIESVSIGTTRQKGNKFEGRKHEVDNNIENHLDDIKEECSGTEEGQQLLSAMRKKFDVEVNDTKVSRSPMLKKSKQVLFGRDEEPAFDALQTLADLSLMMPTDHEYDSRMLFKDDHDYVDETVPLESPPANQPREKRRSSGVRMKGHLASSVEVACSKTSKPGNSSVFHGSSVPEENQDSHQSTTKSRKKQKMPVHKNKKTEVHAEIHLSGSPGVEAGDASKKSIRSKKYSQSSSPKVMKVSENSSGADLQKEGSDSAHSATQVLVNQVNLPTKMRSRRKLSLKKPLVKKDLKFSEKISNNESNLSLGSLHDTVPRFKNLSNCLANQRLRRWCTYEWFYSGIDYPWFAKREFVEYLYHVGLGHVPRLTRVEWGVIRSSLGKPRRFSEQFLKEEKEKLNQYRDTVRKHYSELREGLRDGLPNDLARPLSVGQRVVAIHPKMREIHDGSVLTVDHSKCRVQFDRQELGVEFAMDIDCMPVNPFENMPAMLGRHTITAEMFESFNQLKENGRAKEYIKLSPSDNLDNMDDISALSLLANPGSLLKQSKVASDVPTRPGTGDNARYQQTYSQSSTPLAQIQAKEADIQALAQLTRALDKKEAIVCELRLMNDDVLESQKDGDSPLKESEPFKKQYAAVLIQLNEANEQVSSALHCLRERNTYQGKFPPAWPRPLLGLADPGNTFNSFDRSACQTQEVGSHVNEIMDSSKTKARTMVDAALQAISSLTNRDGTMEKIEEAIDYVNDQLSSDDSCMPRTDPKSSNASDIEAQIPSELITKCVATLLMIQKCTERQFPPSDVAKILDSAVTSLQPRSSQNLPVYTEIQKCVGIIKNQILALIPT
ncbi:protein ALWAYS EARLY 3-like isoform X2 [Salvia splendens]|uniref:protein ALWAYS EARLY 3-like isoform X2 n=1 Tax=Salvia splendens TaxID=180675 RepID=UPI001C26B13E|nr:protein ALWAYS EARLY 3-like isoform X2 [Salvia splendens]